MSLYNIHCAECKEAIASHVEGSEFKLEVCPLCGKNTIFKGGYIGVDVTTSRITTIPAKKEMPEYVPSGDRQTELKKESTIRKAINKARGKK